MGNIQSFKINLLTPTNISESFKKLFRIDEFEIEFFKACNYKKTITDRTISNFRKICLSNGPYFSPQQCFLQCIHYTTLTDEMLRSVKENGLLCRNEIERKKLPSILSFLKDDVGLSLSIDKKAFYFQGRRYDVSNEQLAMIKMDDNTHLEFFYIEPLYDELSCLCYPNNPEFLRDLDEILGNNQLCNQWKNITKSYRLICQIPLVDVDFCFSDKAPDNVFQWLVDNVFLDWAVGHTFNGRYARLFSNHSIKPQNIIEITEM